MLRIRLQRSHYGVPLLPILLVVQILLFAKVLLLSVPFVLLMMYYKNDYKSWSTLQTHSVLYSLHRGVLTLHRRKVAAPATVSLFFWPLCTVYYYLHFFTLFLVLHTKFYQIFCWNIYVSMIWQFPWLFICKTEPTCQSISNLIL